MNKDQAIAHIIERMRKGLSPSLHYHCLDHTLEVLESAKEIGASENIDQQQMDLLLTAAAYHDCGFLNTYTEHEMMSCNMAAEILPTYGYSSKDIKCIQKLIMATQIPQRAEDLLSKVLCDADLDYLGKDNYKAIANCLFKEMNENGVDLNEEKWLDLQINFLEKQNFYTHFSIAQRQSKKDLVLNQLRAERSKQFGNIK